MKFEKVILKQITQQSILMPLILQIFLKFNTQNHFKTTRSTKPHHQSNHKVHSSSPVPASLSRCLIIDMTYSTYKIVQHHFNLYSSHQQFSRFINKLNAILPAIVSCRVKHFFSFPSKPHHKTSRQNKLPSVLKIIHVK